jgi:hypothetical protein
MAAAAPVRRFSLVGTSSRTVDAARPCQTVAPPPLPLQLLHQRLPAGAALLEARRGVDHYKMLRFLNTCEGIARGRRIALLVRLLGERAATGDYEGLALRGLLRAWHELARRLVAARHALLEFWRRLRLWMRLQRWKRYVADRRLMRAALRAWRDLMARRRAALLKLLNRRLLRWAFDKWKQRAESLLDAARRALRWETLRDLMRKRILKAAMQQWQGFTEADRVREALDRMARAFANAWKRWALWWWRHAQDVRPPSTYVRLNYMARPKTPTSRPGSPVASSSSPRPALATVDGAMLGFDEVLLEAPPRAGAGAGARPRTPRSAATAPRSASPAARRGQPEQAAATTPTRSSASAGASQRAASPAARRGQPEQAAATTPTRSGAGAGAGAGPGAGPSLRAATPRSAGGARSRGAASPARSSAQGTAFSAGSGDPRRRFKQHKEESEFQVKPEDKRKVDDKRYHHSESELLKNRIIDSRHLMELALFPNLLRKVHKERREQHELFVDDEVVLTNTFVSKRSAAYSAASPDESSSVAASVTHPRRTTSHTYWV